MPETGNLTTELFWKVSLVTALIDAPFLYLVARGVPSSLFRRLKWHLAGAAGLVYAGLWGVFGSLLYWDTVYSAIFPAWFRWLLPLIYGTLFGTLALLFWRLSLLAARYPVVWFCLLGGLISLVGHGIGASLGLFRVPLLSGASVLSALVFGVFEFIFYWCAITSLAALGYWIRLYLRARQI